ncbi:hypothetical protein Tco_1097484 [Tanacetum coccineum]
MVSLYACDAVSTVYEHDSLRDMVPLGESSKAAGSSRPPVDEIRNYLEVVQILVVHLEDIQCVTLRAIDNLKSVVNLPDEMLFEVQTVKNIFYPTCRSACEALGILGDDTEWDIAFLEACVSATSEELR